MQINIFFRSRDFFRTKFPFGMNFKLGVPGSLRELPGQSSFHRFLMEVCTFIE